MLYVDDFTIDIPAGESSGQNTLEFYADKLADPNLLPLEKAIFGIGGLLAALWTQDASTGTLAAICGALGAKSLVKVKLSDIRRIIDDLAEDLGNPLKKDIADSAEEIGNSVRRNLSSTIKTDRRLREVTELFDPPNSRRGVQRGNRTLLPEPKTRNV